MRKPVMKVFFNKLQVADRTVTSIEDITRSSSKSDTSKSPLKPILLLKYMQKNKLGRYMRVLSDFVPFKEDHFRIAHTPQYVKNFFSGEDAKYGRGSNGLTWTPDFADSVRYTNASLFNAIRYACKNPDQITFSPTSGFHHARPTGGSGFCTFSGQVIASMRLYRKKGLVGSYIDLDGHFGNSIEDSRGYVKDLDKAIPKGFNINPHGHGEGYLVDLAGSLAKLRKKLIDGEIHYVVLCHGADSHVWDDLGAGRLNTKQWLKAAQLVYDMIKEVDQALDRPVPFILSLFGGYRSDSYESVLSLHTASIAGCIKTLLGHQINYSPKVASKYRAGSRLSYNY
jgi:acetoin utilization deacetylase AcuC-like enzyme